MHTLYTIVFHCSQVSLHSLGEYLQPDRCLLLCPFLSVSGVFHTYSKKSEVNPSCWSERADI